MFDVDLKCVGVGCAGVLAELVRMVGGASEISVRRMFDLAGGS